MAVKKKQPAMNNDRATGEFTEERIETETLEEPNEMAVALMGDEVGDPDITALVQEENLEEDVLDLENPQFMAELSEDPVRLYLREIGEVKLLDSDREFRLATIIEANRLVNALRRHPLRKGLSVACGIYHALVTEMLTSYERLLEDTKRLKVHPPGLSEMLAEAQALSSGWESDLPSYLRAYLDNGRWGTDELWNGIAHKAYRVFLSLYLFPPQYADWLLNH